jgi:hypothetical protein
VDHSFVHVDRSFVVILRFCLCVHCFALRWLYVGIALPSFFVRESFMWVGFEVGTLLGS